MAVLLEKCTVLQCHALQRVSHRWLFFTPVTHFTLAHLHVHTNITDPQTACVGAQRGAALSKQQVWHEACGSQVFFLLKSTGHLLIFPCDG